MKTMHQMNDVARKKSFLIAILMFASIAAPGPWNMSAAPRNDSGDGPENGKNANGKTATGKSGAKPSAGKKNTRGFLPGKIQLSLMGGASLASGGSFLRHEKDFDANLRTQYLLHGSGRIQSFAPGIPAPPPLHSSYSANPIAQFDMEYGAASRLGLGFSIFQFSLDARRQNVIRELSYEKQTIEPYARERMIYMGTAATVLIAYHPWPARRFDPYLALRAGIVGFSGEARQYLTHDPLRGSDRVSGGRGGIYGGGIGINFYMSPELGFRLELSGYNQALRSDLFSVRRLHSYHGLFGIFIRVS